MQIQADTSPVVRPRSATVIAWIWIVIAVVGIFSGIADYFKVRELATVRLPDDANLNAIALFDRFEALIGGTPLELALTAIFGSVVIAGAIGLLKLRSWGRWTLIVVTWTGLVGILIGQPLYLLEVTDLATIGTNETTTFEIFVWLIGLAQLAFATVVFGFMLRSLHSRRLRDAIQLAHRRS